MAERRRLEQTRPSGHGRARGLVSSRVSGARVGARTYLPAEDLADVVASYWSGDWDLRGQAPHDIELVADPSVNIAFEAGEDDPGARVVGVWTRLWQRRVQGCGRVRAVKLRPGALRAFLDVRAADLSNRVTPLVGLMEDAPELEAAVTGPESDDEALAALERWLRGQRRPQDREDVSLAVAIVQRIAEDPGITSVKRLCEVAGLTVRPLQRLFREHVGAPPKWLIRQNRLQEVALRIERGDVPSLADLAAELGYADQAHLTRDFKAVVGKSPSAFAESVWR